MVESESGFIADRISPRNKNGTRDKGLFQLNTQYHYKFINSREFIDPYNQITYGCSLWRQYKQKGILRKRWYGYNNIISNPKAMENVKNRFTIVYDSL